LIGQGLGNSISPLFGGIPGAGATMLMGVNIRSGGKMNLTGFAHGMLLLAILPGLGRFAAYILHSVLPGILISAGIGIIDYKGCRNHCLKLSRRCDAMSHRISRKSPYFD